MQNVKLSVMVDIYAQCDPLNTIWSKNNKVKRKGKLTWQPACSYKIFHKAWSWMSFITHHNLLVAVVVTAVAVRLWFIFSLISFWVFSIRLYFFAGLKFWKRFIRFCFWFMQFCYRQWRWIEIKVKCFSKFKKIVCCC